MQLFIDKKYTKDVLIITPKKEEDKILYFTINIENDFELNNHPNIIPYETINEDGMWYKYTSIYGERMSHLFCKDDCLVILYKFIEEKNGIDKNILGAYYTSYDLSDSKLKFVNYIFWEDKDCTCNMEFIEFIKYYMQTQPLDEYKKDKFSNVIHYPFYELSRKYYEDMNKKQQTSKYGYGLSELNSLFIEYFEEIMPKESYNVYFDLQIYNKTYVPKQYYNLDNKMKGDVE